MDIGISISSSHPGDPVAGANAMVQRARAASQAKLSTLSLGDHHARPQNYFANTPMLGRLLAEWNLRSAGCLFLLPLWHPVLVAEQVGTLASMLSARFIVQTGVGSGQAQFAAMGADLRHRGQLIDESIRLVKDLLAGAQVNSDVYRIVDAVVAPRPVQPVEWWIGAGSGPGLRRAAREGDAWYAGPGVLGQQLDVLTTEYRSACAELARPARVVLRRDVLILADRKRAEMLASNRLAHGYRGLTREHLVVGDVESAVEQLEPFAAAGVEQVVARCVDVGQNEALETIALLGQLAGRLR